MILWLALYAISGLAQTNDLIIQEYCFIHEAKMNQAMDQLKFILVPTDKVQKNQSCATIMSQPHRRELIQNYVTRLDPTVRIAFSSAETRRDPCQLKVEKLSSTLSKGIESSARADINSPKIELTASQMNKQRSDVTKIQTLKEFELSVNQDVIKGECRPLSPTRYEIKIEVRRDALPLTPPIQLGTSVPVPESSINQVQETSKLQTTLQLSVGERIEIGEVIRNLEHEGKKIDVSSSAELTDLKKQETEKVFLSLD